MDDTEGYQKIKERVQHIGTVETVENAREIEAARALGDLRENSEYSLPLKEEAVFNQSLRLSVISSIMRVS